MLPKMTAEVRVARDPEIRFTPSGTAVGKVRVVCSDRKKGSDNKWADFGEPFFFDVTTFGKVAENLAESVKTGDLLVVTGKFKVNEWQSPEGERRWGGELVADEIGVSIQYGTAKTPRMTGDLVLRDGGTAAGVPDPWAAPAVASGVGDDLPPF